MHRSTFCRLLLFLNEFIKKYISNKIKVLNSLDSDQSQNCLQMLSADDKICTVENFRCKFIHHLLSTWHHVYWCQLRFAFLTHISIASFFVECREDQAPQNAASDQGLHC